MIDWTEIPNGETWELFARDFLQSLDFRILEEPGRGADGGKDLLALETVRGSISTSTFRWLVSCKHFAASNRSVTPDDEPSVRDRLEQHRADGFMGFYSTLPSSAFLERLKTLRRDNAMGYFIWDGKAIEGSLLSRNQGDLLIRYLPNSYAQLRPISVMLGKKLPLECENCGKDVLTASVREQYKANVIFASDEAHQIVDVIVCCKGACDKILEQKLFKRGLITSWEDVTDMCNPLIYLRRFFAFMNNVRDKPSSFSDEAYEKLKHVLTAFAQRTLRQPLPDDEKRYRDVLPLEGL